MDRRLFQACWIGNVENFLKLIKDNPRLLYTSVLENGETPLHIASMVGHFNLVKEIMKLRKEFSQELNEDGLSTVNVIRELILASAYSVVNMTARGETVLHLAVKNNQFEALNDLVEHLKKFNKDVLNRKDDQGNTFLHLAVSKKHEAGDREIAEILRQAEAMRAKELHTLRQLGMNQNQAIVAINPSSDQSTPNHQPRSPAKRLLNYFKYNMDRDSPSEAQHIMLVIAILIATTTYQTMHSPLGGVWADDSVSSNNNGNNNAFEPHKVGQAIIVFAHIVTYDTCMAAITSNDMLWIFFTVISSILPILILIATKVARNYQQKARTVVWPRNQESVQSEF
ncbi:hypothetical protein ACSBR1_009077 [Camellia fascicularis]